MDWIAFGVFVIVPIIAFALIAWVIWLTKEDRE